MTTPVTSLRFLEGVKTTVVGALRTTFDNNYPDKELQNLNVSMEYPDEETQYPGIWVRFSFTTLQTVGVASRFYNSSNQEYKLWYFEGRCTLQLFAMTSLQRDRIADALIYMFAFGELTPFAKRFGDYFHDNDMIYMTPNTDTFVPGGQEETVGAPWQPDAIVYGDSYSFNIVGQFASDFATGELVVLREIDINPQIS
jgi:hypothetical protein